MGLISFIVMYVFSICMRSYMDRRWLWCVKSCFCILHTITWDRDQRQAPPIFLTPTGSIVIFIMIMFHITKKVTELMSFIAIIA